MKQIKVGTKIVLNSCEYVITEYEENGLKSYRAINPLKGCLNGSFRTLTELIKDITSYIGGLTVVLAQKGEVLTVQILDGEDHPSILKMGCICSNIVDVLEPSYVLETDGTTFSTLYLDEKNIQLDNIEVGQLSARYETDLNTAIKATINILSPLHEEEYLYDKEKKEFRLNKQGLGYA